MKKIAWNVLAIPASTVASESDFSMSGIMLSPHRSYLHFDIVDVLISLHNWIVGEFVDSNKIVFDIFQLC